MLLFIAVLLSTLPGALTPGRAAHSWTIETIDQDPTGFTNLAVSVAVDSVGIPHVAYSLLHPDAALKYGVRLPSGWNIEEVQSGNGSADASLKLDGLGRPHIAFFGSWAGRESLSYASKVGANWTVEVVDGGPGCGRYASLGFDAGDVPHVAYLCSSPGALKHAWWGGTRWINETVATGAADPSLAFDASGRPTIAYAVPGSVELRRAYFDGTRWASELVEGNVVFDDRGTSIARDRSGVLHISYMESVSGQLRYASRGPLAWGVEVVDTPVTRFCGGTHESSLAFNRSNAPNIAYRVCKDGVRDVQLAAKDMTTGSWSLESVAVGGLPSLAIDPYDNPHIGFLAYSQGLVRYAFVPPTDSAPPSSRVLPIAPYWHTAGPVTVNATASDSETAVVEVSLFYAFARDNATWGSWAAFATDEAPPWSWDFPFPDGNGNYRFFSIATDLAGNVEAAKSLAEALAGHRTPPDYTLENPLPVSPAVIGVGLDLSLSVVVRNLGGDANATSTLAFFNGSTPGSPFASFPVPALPASGGEGPVTATWRSPSGLGSYTVTALADYGDAVAETNETNNAFTWTIDVVPGPVTTLVVGAPNVTAGGTYVTSSTPQSFVVFDQGGGGIRTTSYRVDGGTWINYTATGTFTLAVEGSHSVEWFSEDFAGNVESVSNATLLVDDTPPATAFSIGDPKYVAPDTFVTSSTPFALQALDGGATPVGPAATEYRVDGGPWTPYSAPFSAGGEGRHAVDYRSTDLLGNVEPIQTLEIVVDDTPPVATLSIEDPKYLVGGAFVTSATPLSLAATDGGITPVGVSSVEFRIDGASWTAFANPFTLSDEGAHVVEFRSADLLGNQEPARTVSFVVDDTPPAVTIDVGLPRYVSAATYVRSDTPLTLAATDGGPIPAGVASLEYDFGGPWIPYSGAFTLAGSDGSKTVEFRATDLLGNAAVGQLALVLDNSPPVTTPSHGDGTYPTGTAFAFPARDDGSGVARTEIRVDGGAWTTYTTPLVLAEGDHTIGFRSVDNLNNMEAEGVLSVKVAGAPVVTPETNWKPLVAAVFSMILALVGAWSARRVPWATGSRRSLRAFAFTALPFVVLEGATGVLSLLTGLLSIPPLLGAGTAVDVGILLTGIGVSAYRVRKWIPPK